MRQRSNLDIIGFSAQNILLNRESSQAARKAAVRAAFFVAQKRKGGDLRATRARQKSRHGL